MKLKVHAVVMLMLKNDVPRVGLIVVALDLEIFEIENFSYANRIFCTLAILLLNLIGKLLG